MAKFCIFSDAHGDLRPLKRIAPTIDYFLSCGDLAFYDEGVFPKPLYTILGNHEMWVFIPILKRAAVRINNFHLMESGKSYAVGRLHLAGLNGNFSPSYKSHPRHFSKEDVEKCLKLRGVDIFLSHEAPSGIGLVNKRNGENMGVKLINEIINSVKPKFLFCGHHHLFVEAEIGDTKIVCLPKFQEGYVIFDGEKMTYEFVKCSARTNRISV